ncbi:hypothetical protein O0I10_003821 [Lichtheimia ornata]|uniref:Uncharacterized protein n=1 Tax=Lichtheimia ornata TaxID=688661 RepID=A0AAD7XX57_9FUNG|nr:uncharacterized protein O0I10_003821 [Lichtheimia ornata]KAJ8660364.1 hypothetical protein O0I10_003821 [Lichtheimia ornata]
MDPKYIPYHHSLPSSVVNTNAISADVNVEDPMLPHVPQDHLASMYLHGISYLDQLSTMSAQTLPGSEACCVASDVAHVVSQCSQSQGGLSNTDLVSQMTSWAITFITDDDFLREYYYWLTIYRLYTNDTQWDCLSHLPPETAPSSPALSPPSSASSASSPPPSSPPQESACSPLTMSDVSSEGRPACDNCHRTFSRRDALHRHLEKSCTYNRKGYTSQHVFSAFE